MGEEDNSKKQHVIFGSAGMAAAGMMRGAKARPKSEERSREDEPEEEISDPVEEIPDPVEVRENAADETETNPPEEEISTADSAETAIAAFEGHRAAVIGHSGKGDFGAKMDAVFQRLDGVRLFGLVDLDENSVDESRDHVGALEGYTEVEALLRESTPDLVSIAPSSTALRSGQIKAVLEAGCHVICEAPLARTLKECDEILSMLSSTDRCMAVRHPMRL